MLRSALVSSRRFLLAGLCVLASAGTRPALAQESYQLFEAGQVRPLALSPDGTHLFAVNTPDARLEIFDVAPNGQLTPAGSVPVGLEPVAVAARGDDEVWVVNHLSDSVSVVALTPAPRVVRTLLVGDEPRDLVFAGTNDRFAFVTTAHRGQHSPNGGRANRADPDAPDASAFETPGVGRADVWVFDTTSLGSELGGTPARVLTLFGDRPRALAKSPDGSRVYAAIFQSGNRTTVVNEGLVCDTSGSRLAANTVQPSCQVNGVTIPGGTPPPHADQDGVSRPETGLILKLDRPGATAGQWSDELGRNWNAVVKFDLPDRDVFEIDASQDPPVAVDAGPACQNGAGCWAGVGTVLFGLAVNPVSGKIYVSNTDSQNHVRFEGPGIRAAGPNGKLPQNEPPTLQGDLARARITVLSGASVGARALNKHLDYSQLPASASDKARSLATPLGMAVTPDGARLYVAAFGSDEIGVFDTAELESNTFDPAETDPGATGFVGHIALGGGGPSGLVLGASKLYVLTRFDDSVRVVDLTSESEEQAIALHSPEPQEVIAGRPFLYSAKLTSSNGEASCASCHVFGDLDSLGWDLGNPDTSVVANTNPFNPLVPQGAEPFPRTFHGMKGPMTTQSLRGLANMGPEHWRGDRQGDEVTAFEAFNAAFPALLGRETPLSPQDMTRFRRFALRLRYPPNPIRRLDGGFRPDEAAGAALYSGRVTDAIANCNGCHTLDPAAGHFGGDGLSIFDGETQHMKIPHLRNQYQKVGMFGMSEPGGSLLLFSGDFSHQGPQIRGFGFLHDGSVDSMGRFLGLTGFSLNAVEETQLEAFVMAFPTDLAPIVGQQVTLSSDNFGEADVQAQIDLLIARAGTPFSSQVLGGTTVECDLVAQLREAGVARAYLYHPGTARFLPDHPGASVTDAALRDEAQVPGQELTYTCVPPGSGARMALDRDEDGLLNGVETGTGVFVSAADTGSDPANRDSDGDGFPDGVEVPAGADPNDPGSFPAGSIPGVPALAPLAQALLAATLLYAGLRRAGRGRPQR